MTATYESHSGCCAGDGDLTVPLDAGFLLRLSGTRVMVVGARDAVFDLSDDQLLQAIGLLTLAGARRGWNCPG